MLFRSMALAFALFASNAQAAPLDRALEQKMAANAQRYVIASQALLVARNGDVVFRNVAGARRDELFPVYSLSKLLASVLAMQLVEAGQLDLDKPASAYLPALPLRWQQIPVRHFLNHSSGLPEYFDLGSATGPVFPPTLQAVFATLADKPLVFEPGTAIRYTQTNFLVLEALLEAHYGRPYTQIANERIINKLGLKNTYLGLGNASRHAMVRSFIGKNGKLQADPAVPWPEYANVHAELFTTVDDLAAFLHAVARGELVGKETLRVLWQPQKLANGQEGWFASGWEFGTSGGYQYVGHDGGTKVRVRLLWPDSNGDDRYTIIYLTNGSAQNVWSRTLVESVLPVIDPGRFSMEAVSEQLIDYASRPAVTPAQGEALVQQLQTLAARDGAALERRINETGYAMLETRGSAAAVKVFELNTRLFPQSGNARDSLAQAQAAAKTP
ncbi:CubicO group peptidase, beta-lactamase class C family [Duganella sp. CF458]|uniref:serine hydrolase domain-containing protein n=1 Tax=Duganella sp. CF458 TaxID=1884368 RepID=UPI0008EAB871|nr:serine hydrolase domain-containing protein [Duganella sp. CF458]SFG21705.1 CubicO group peptidase, beta-lactamase class C family [Duganella sp. CF458]